MKINGLNVQVCGSCGTLSGNAHALVYQVSYTSVAVSGLIVSYLLCVDLSLVRSPQRYRRVPSLGRLFGLSDYRMGPKVPRLFGAAIPVYYLIGVIGYVVGMMMYVKNGDLTPLQYIITCIYCSFEITALIRGQFYDLCAAFRFNVLFKNINFLPEYSACEVMSVLISGFTLTAIFVNYCSIKYMQTMYDQM